MRKYNLPQMNIKNFTSERILTASSGQGETPTTLTSAEQVRQMMEKDGISAIAEVAFE